MTGLRRDPEKTDNKPWPIRWEYDFPRQPFRPRLKPLPAPDSGIFDAPYVCIRINMGWLTHIIGVLQVLLELDAWTGTDEQQYDAKQEIEKLLASMEDECGEGLPPLVTSFRFTEECVLQYSNDNGTTWSDIPGWSAFAEACFKGDPGEDGADGEDGAPGLPGQDGEDGECLDCGNPYDDTPPPDETPSDGLRCGVAINVAKELRVKWNESYDYLGVNVGLGIVGIVAGIIQLLTPTGVTQVTGVATLITSFVTLILSIEGFFEGNAFDDATEERYRCELYCLLDQDGLITPEIFASWKAFIAGDQANNFQAPAIAELLGIVPFEYWQFVGYTSPEINAAACEDCDCGPWCYTFHFNATDGGFSGIAGANPDGVYVGGSGWQAEYLASQSIVQMAIHRTFSASQVTEVTAVFDATAGTNNETNFYRLRINNGGTNLHQWEINPATTGTGLTLGGAFTEATATEVTFAAVPGNRTGSNNNPGGSFTLKSITMRGTGDNPFGEDNCE